MLGMMERLSGRDLGEMNRYALVAVVEAVLAAAPFGLIYFLLEGMLAGGGRGLGPWAYALATALCLTARYWVGRWLFIKSNLLGYGAGRDIRLRLGEHLEALPLGYFGRGGRFGDVSNALLGDVAMAESMFSYLYIQIVSICSLSLIMALALLFLDWRLALALLGPLALGAWSFLALRRKAMALGASLRQAMGELNDSIIEYVRSLKTLKAFNMAGNRFQRLRQAMALVHKRLWRTELWGAMPVFTFTTLVEIGFPLMVILACHLWLRGDLALAVMIFFFVIALRVIRPVQGLAVFMAEESIASQAGQRLLAILDEPALPSGDKPLPQGPLDIRLEKISFGYGDAPVIHDIDLTIPQGSVVALVGPSGAGKSTLANLIARFWDVDAGRITLGGVDIREIATDQLMAAVSMVFQDVYLFNDTVLNNLKVADPTASQEQVERACRLAMCHDFILRLPQGYQTVLGEGGGTLSGGERQRLSLARALLKDAPIVLLDEATASLDPENELEMQKAIGNLVTGRTIVVIAHRLYSVAEADTLVVLEKGRVVERGGHEQLLALNGLYRRMWDDQQSAGRWSLRA